MAETQQLNALSAGTKLLLLRLLETRKPLAVAEIADKAGITRRMARYRLSEAQSWLGLHGLSLARKRGVGIWISGETDRAHVIREITSLDTYEVRIPSTERQGLLALLLLCTECQSPHWLARRLSVSRSTVLRDVAEIEEWFVGRGLNLVTETRGIRVTGSELAKRRAIAEVVTEDSWGGRLPNVLADRKDVAGPAGRVPADVMESMLSVVLKRQSLGKFAEAAARVERDLGRRMSDLGRVRLIIHLAITVDRLLAGKSIGSLPDSDYLRTTPEFVIAQRLLRDMAPGSPSVDDAEAAYVASQLLGAQYVDSGGAPCTALDALGTTLSMVRTAEKFLGVSLADDQLLVQGLANHMLATYHRLRFGLRLANPLSLEIHRKYPHYYLVGEAMAEDFRRVTGYRLPEPEIAYIVMHLGAAMQRLGSVARPRRVLVVCPTGVGTTNLLVSQIAAHFPMLQVVATSSMSDVAKNLPGADLVVSTVPLEGISIPVVIVSPVLGNSDVTGIGSHLAQYQTPVAAASDPAGGETFERLARALVEVNLDVQARDWEEAVRQGGELLIKHGCATEEYREATVSWIRRLGGYSVLQNGLVIPHAPFSEGGLHQGFSFVRLGRPVYFPGRESEPVDTLISFVCPFGESSRETLDDINRLSSCQEAMSALRGASDAAQVFTILNRHHTC